MPLFRRRSPAPPAALALVALLAAPIAAAPAHAAGPLVGEPAPPLAVQSWLGGAPVERFEPGRIYVLDIWAPWCTPCIAGMPGLDSLARHYADRGVVVLGLTGDDDYGSTIEKARRVLGRLGSRVAYANAWDRDRATYERWMAREKTSGWPWSWVVDRDGRIAWTGHPNGLEPVLERVVAGTWNRDSAAAAYAHRAAGLDLAAGFAAHYKAARNDAALADYRRLRAHDPAMAAGYAPHAFKTLLVRQGRRDEAYAFLRGALDSLIGESPDALSAIAATIADSATAAPLRDLDVALRCAERAWEKREWPNPAVLATVARVHARRGDWERAVATQARALALADSLGIPGHGEALARYRARRP